MGEDHGTIEMEDEEEAKSFEYNKEPEKKLRRVAIYAVHIADNGEEGRLIFMKYAPEFQTTKLPPLAKGWEYQIEYNDVGKDDIDELV